MDPPQPESESESEWMDPRETGVWDIYPDKPTRFKAHMAYASGEGANPDRCEDVMPQWSYIEESYDGPGVCICSQEITRHHLLRNDKTKLTIAIGSECIKKFGTDEQKELLEVRERRANYTGEKSMCCHCTRNLVVPERAQRAVPLCEPCLVAGHMRPSVEYLKAFGVRCIVCNENRVVPGSKITCCHSCKQYNCQDCDAPLHDTTKEMQNWGDWQHCPYCAREPIECGTYCLTCRAPLSKKSGVDYGEIECKTCKYKPRKPMIRHCEDCNSVLPSSHAQHWKRCDSCQHKENEELRTEADATDTDEVVSRMSENQAIPLSRGLV